MSKEFSHFLKTFPDAGKAYLKLFKSVTDAPRLSPKTKQLILIAVMTAQNYPEGVRAHVPQAIEAGATREEIAEAMLTTLPVAGINGLLQCLPEAVEIAE
jgi:AhpD family alkylhydroperoxidase